MVVSSKEPGSDYSRESWGPRFTYVYLTKCIIKSFHRTHWDKTMVSISRVVQKTSGSLKLKLGPKAKPEEVLEVLPREAELIKSLCCLRSPSHFLLFPAPRHKASHEWLGGILIWMQQIPAGPVLSRQDLLLGLSDWNMVASQLKSRLWYSTIALPLKVSIRISGVLVRNAKPLSPSRPTEPEPASY